jgi:hypothetical protein
VCPVRAVGVRRDPPKPWKLRNFSSAAVHTQVGTEETHHHTTRAL